MSTPTSPGVDRVCGTCGRTAAPHEYFCHRCTSRLPDPPDHVAAERRMRLDTPTATVGWPVLLTVLGVVVVVGAVIAGAVLALVRLDLFAADPDRPEVVVLGYYEAVQADDCAAAAEREVEVHRSPARCARDVARLAGTDDGDLRVEDELVLDRDASVRVRVTLDDGDFERCTFDLRLDEEWLIQDAVCGAPTPAP